jgi:hypothetical protein
LTGERNPYTSISESSILFNASRELYFIDEGESLGAVDRHLLIGADPSVDEYSFANPLRKAGVIQTIYASLMPRDIVDRVRHCKRPGGGAVNITFEDANEILFEFKKAMEGSWSEGWDDEVDGEVQFVGFFDNFGSVIGTTGRMLEDMTLNNSKLLAISVALIALFSALFLCSSDVVESRILITAIGVALVVLAFFAALGFCLLIGIRIAVSVSWTLPFILMGLGVDDMYIIL